MYTVYALVAIICLIRLTVKPALNLKDTYKNLAHIFVGGLFGAAIVIWHQTGSTSTALWLGVGMTVFETVCGVVGAKTKMSMVDLFRSLVHV